MPRRRARFSKLMDQYQQSGGVGAAGSRVAGFKEFLEGRSKIKVADSRKLSAAARKRFQVCIIPFGIKAGTDALTSTQVLTQATAYSLSGMADRLTGLTDADLGHIDSPSATAAQVLGFYPALVKVTCTRASAVVETPRSAITGQEYSYLPGRTFSLPFGRKVASLGDDFSERAKALKGDIATITGVRSVSFEEEQMNEVGGKGLDNFAAGDKVTVS